LQVAWLPAAGKRGRTRSGPGREREKGGPLAASFSRLSTQTAVGASLAAPRGGKRRCSGGGVQRIGAARPGGQGGRAAPFPPVRRTSAEPCRGLRCEVSVSRGISRPHGRVVPAYTPSKGW